jgi:hypothetical protein
MSSKFKFLGIVAVTVLAMGIFVSTAIADITGNFGTHIAFIPQSTASEIELMDIDFQNELNITAVISGLSTTFHTHFGIAGVEDVQVTSAATLGALDISTRLVFARFAFGSIDPFYDSLHFVKKAVRASIQLGGVQFSNLAQFEDTNAFVSQTAAYAFGDVISISGQTPSGISITAATGICMQQIPNSIKKHFGITPYTVNPDCATEPKPDLLFDFERITISGVPVAPNVTAGAVINCVTVNACSLVTTFAFSGGVIPFSASLTFTDLLSLDFNGASIVLTSGAGTLTLNIGPDGSLGVVSVAVVATLNPDTNPASLTLTASAVPGVGLTSATVALSIQRAGLSISIVAVFTGGPPAQFSGITFSLNVPGPLLSLQSAATFGVSGMVQADIWLTIAF